MRRPVGWPRRGCCSLAPDSRHSRPGKPCRTFVFLVVEKRKCLNGSEIASSFCNFGPLHWPRTYPVERLFAANIFNIDLDVPVPRFLDTCLRNFSFRAIGDFFDCLNIALKSLSNEPDCDQIFNGSASQVVGHGAIQDGK